MKTNNVKIVCPITRVVTLLSDTWTMLIMHVFLNESTHPEKRFCELERALPGISTRTLTNKLKILETEGLLEKTESRSYKITKRGTGLQLIEDAMRIYEKKFLK
ncbi:MAG TPA: helix-turn-helix domain-containing protein [Candidatus Paceibacterota bacterium]|nr:helix-turn-helix domain-containing protein [Candidatus Paceibacterota bacterium]